MIFVTTQHFFSAHSAEVVEAGVLIKTFLQMMGRKRWSFVLYRWFKGPILIWIEGDVFDFGDGVEDD